MTSRPLFSRSLHILVVLAVILSNIYAQDRTFTIGVRGGLSVPHHWMLQGWYSIGYDADGTPTDITVSGFGDGGEVTIYGSYTNPSGAGWLLELGARFLQRKTDLTLAPDGNREAYDNYLNTFYPVAVSRVHRFTLEGARAVPYLGAGAGFYITNWNAQHDRRVGETLSRTVESTRFTGLGLHGIAGFHYALYYDIVLETQFRYTWIPSEVRIVDDETGTWITHEGLNIGGVSLHLGLAYSF